MTSKINKSPSDQNNRESSKIRSTRFNKDLIDFSKVGGLSHHIKTLRELIIFPLLHSDVYKHFSIKAPRGVLFYGPPGTGKTLVAGALAKELNNEGLGKVTFFHRKGADLLDKWFGESERKLTELFEKASKNRPSVIFFDEIDGLAPARCDRDSSGINSVVSTLLAVMDGLDKTPGVVVIGATNRIDAIDSALRRPGRFDKELYFPMPCKAARKEILEVHVRSWKHHLSDEFLDHLASITAGFCGADLQALCAEAVLSCTKRLCPGLDNLSKGKVKLNVDKIKVEDSDFLNAVTKLVPLGIKIGSKMRNLCPIIKPLLERQIENIISHIEVVWPHFLEQDYKYNIYGNRYAGRLLLKGTNKQGLSTHIIPAILKILEHLPVCVVDIPDLCEQEFSKFKKQLPSLLVLLRVDEWWEHVEDYLKVNLSATLDDIHAGLPILTIASCKEELPEKLRDFFYENCSITLQIENPTEKERAQFFAPLFFEKNRLSVFRILMNTRNINLISNKIKKEIVSKTTLRNVPIERKIPREHQELRLRGGAGKNSKDTKAGLSSGPQEIRDGVTDHIISKERLRRTNASTSLQHHFTNNVFPFLETNIFNNCVQSVFCDKIIKVEPVDAAYDDSSSIPLGHTFDSLPDFPDQKEDCQTIHNLWNRVSFVTSANMSLTQLEMLYDAVALCINMNKNNFPNLVKNIEQSLSRIENSQRCR